MLFRQKFLTGIRKGSITLAFRRWTRPTVRSGGTLLTPVGLLDIGKVSRVTESRITPAEALQAGYPTREALLAELAHRPTGEIYRIELRGLQADPRIGLRETKPTREDVDSILRRLERLDLRGAWTAKVLDILADHPAVRAADLCGLAGMEKEDFKVNVRKLKNLGLTESLGTGYRLSPRGEAIRAALKGPRRGR
jgi:hypothetical protein